MIENAFKEAKGCCAARLLVPLSFHFYANAQQLHHTHREHSHRTNSQKCITENRKCSLRTLTHNTCIIIKHGGGMLQYQPSILWCFMEYCYWIKWRYKLDHNGTSLIKCVHNHCYLVWDVFHFTKEFLCHCGYWEQHFLLGLSLLHLLCSCLMLVWLWTEGAAHPILNRQ